MKIKKLQTCNFQGLRGKKEYCFGEDTVYALCLNNGSGKTSFLNAIRYGLSGYKQGSILSLGTSMSAVGLTFDDDVSVIRQEFADKSPKYYLNSGSVTKKMMEEKIVEETGVQGSVMKIVTSSEVLEKMSKQEFGELLLSFIPEQLSIETVFEYLGEMPEPVRNYLSVSLPDGDFGMDVIDEIYKNAFETRREVKKRIAASEAVVHRPVPKTEKRAVDYLKEQEALQELQKETIKRIKEKASFDKIRKYREEQEANLKGLRVNLSRIALPKNVPDRKEVFDKLQWEQEKVSRSSSVLGTLKQNLTVLEKALDNIDKPVCPLSEKLVCTTDKSVVKKEISAAVYETRNAIKVQEINVETAMMAVKEYQRQLQAVDEMLVRVKEADSLKRQIDQIEKNLPELPPDPGEIPDADKLIDEMNRLIGLQKAAEEYERYENALTAHNALITQLNTMEYVVNAFSPKGTVRQHIAEYYVKTFEDECNRKAEELKAGFRIRFENNSGINIKTDVGDGYFRDYNSLSGGERIYVMFLVMDMLCNLTGLGILVFDEMSILDTDAFRSLLRLINENKDDYDMVFLSAAEHMDIRDSFTKHGIKLLEV